MIASLLVPFSVQASPGSSSAGNPASRGKTKARSVHAAPAPTNREVVYITSRDVTGSHIPLVVCRYNGRYNSLSTVAVYGRPDLDRTGQLDVGGELLQTDPAISSVGSFRR